MHRNRSDRDITAITDIISFNSNIFQSNHKVIMNCMFNILELKMGEGVRELGSMPDPFLNNKAEL